MKKILAICIVAIFLITSLGIISAAEDTNSISVKVIGDDLTDQIKVNLLCDGKVVDTAILDSTNSWKTTFKVDADGNYKIKTEDISDYSISIKGDADKGFVITTKLAEQDVLGAANVEESDNDVIAAENGSLDDGIIAANEGNSSNGILTANNTNNSTNGTNATGNSTDDNSTSDENSTEDNATAVGSSNGDNSAQDNEPAKKTVTKKVTKKTVTKKVNKPANNTKTKYKTGLPVVVLVLAAMVAIFVPFARKK